MPQLLLKARPIPAQLADRLSDPHPDGLELYLDVADLVDEAAMDGVVSTVEACPIPETFSLTIEGPVGSLDGEFFDPTRGAEADAEVVRRLARLARRLGAEVVNVHLIAPTPDPRGLTLDARAAGLVRASEFARFLVQEIGSVGAVPTIENMPPVLRMRQAGFFFSPIGMPAEDLVWVCEQAPGLAVTLDLSHAGLYLNCQRLAAAVGRPGPELGGAPELYNFVAAQPSLDDLFAYARALGPLLVSCHVANASGLLGEGAPYDHGDFQLDPVISGLAPQVRFFVTETLEQDNNHAVEMRRALAAMRRALQEAQCT